MVTPVPSTILGASPDYTSLQAWNDDFDDVTLPIDLVAADEQHDALCRGVDLSDGMPTLTVTGQTTDPTRFLRVTTDAGASFADTVQALTFDTANGAFIDADDAHFDTINVQTPHTRIEKLQIQRTSSAVLGNGCLNFTGAADGSSARNMLVQWDGSDGGTGMNCDLGCTGLKYINSISICSTTANAVGLSIRDDDDTMMVNCTIVVPDDVDPGDGGSGIVGEISAHGGPDLYNNCVFGWESGDAFFLITGGTYTHNASDDSTVPGTSTKPSLTYADSFIDVSDATQDFRLKSGSELINNGTRRENETFDLDIFGQPRSVSTPDIGCFEFQAAAAPAGVVGGQLIHNVTVLDHHKSIGY